MAFLPKFGNRDEPNDSDKPAKPSGGGVRGRGRDQMRELRGPDDGPEPSTGWDRGGQDRPHSADRGARWDDDSGWSSPPAHARDGGLVDAERDGLNGSAWTPGAAPEPDSPASRQRPAAPVEPPQAAPWDPIVVEIAGPVITAKPPVPGSGYRPDTECDGWSTPYATLRLASVRGTSHRHYGKPRQDSAASLADPATETIMFAVADGVSGAKSGELGANDACYYALDAIRDQVDERRAGTDDLDTGRLGDEWRGIDWFDVVTHAADALFRRAGRTLRTDQPDVRQVEELYATTLVTGVARRGPGGLEIELCRVGDSGAWVLDPAGRYHPLFSSKTDSDSGLMHGAVSALPRLPRQLEQARFLLGEGQALLVGTDGFGDPLGDGDGMVGGLFAEHLAVPPTPAWLAHLLDFSRETFDDDRTLLALWPRGERRPR